MDLYVTPASLKAALQHPVLTDEEEARLSARIKRGDKRAIKRLVECNTRFAFTLARDFARNPGDVEDFFSAAITGLMAAAPRYDARRSNDHHTKFASYARWYVIREMRAHLRRTLSGSTSLPIGGAALLSKVRKYAASFREDNGGREPTPAEIAAGIGARVDKVFSVLAVSNGMSLDASISKDGDGMSLHEVVEDESAGVAALAESADRLRLLSEALAKLSPIEREVLSRRFGLGNRTPRILEEIGKEYNITRERVRQIEAAALRALRTHVARKTSKFAELAA